MSNELVEPECVCTTEELALELGSSPIEAKAISARIERLTGHSLEVVSNETRSLPE